MKAIMIVISPKAEINTKTSKPSNIGSPPSFEKPTNKIASKNVMKMAIPKKFSIREP